MTAHLALFANDLAQIVAQSDSSDNDFSSIGLIFLLSGFAFYAMIYFKYRNTNKRHSHESETEASMHNMKTEDHRVRSLKGLSNSRMSGENSTEVKGARHRFF